jgi:phage terminase small subunit
VSRLKNIRHENFCQLFVFGNPAHDPDDESTPPDTLHNATQAYIQAGYAARGNAASVNGSRLLRRPDIQERVTELREEAEHMARTRVFRWGQLLADAQEALRRALAGEEVSTQAVSAAKEIVAQAQGPAHLRFKDPKSGKERVGIPVFVFGGDGDEE